MSRLLTLHDPQTACEYYAQGVWRDDTLYSLLREHARERPDAYALRDSRRRLTWSQLAVWVEALAARGGVAAQRGRSGSRFPCLLAQWLRVQSFAASELHRRRHRPVAGSH